MASAETLQEINPGSFNQFVSIRKFATREEALGAYSMQLHEYRLALAAHHGVSVEDLRDFRA